jgi:RNA polymerase sigma-70 factor (ECF subfamily)
MGVLGGTKLHLVVRLVSSDPPMTVVSLPLDQDASELWPARLSFEETYDEYFDFVWLSLRRLGVAPVLLDDAAQDVFVVVHRRLHEFEFRSELKTWLFAIALRTAQSYRRQRQPVAVESLEQLPGAGPSPHEALAQAEALRIMDNILSGMDEERRVLLIMVELEQIAVSEAAEVLGLKLNTAYSRLRLAREDFNAQVKRHQARDHWRQG